MVKSHITLAFSRRTLSFSKLSEGERGGCDGELSGQEILCAFKSREELVSFIGLDLLKTDDP